MEVSFPILGQRSDPVVRAELLFRFAVGGDQGRNCKVWFGFVCLLSLIYAAHERFASSLGVLDNYARHFLTGFEK